MVKENDHVNKFVRNPMLVFRRNVKQGNEVFHYTVAAPGPGVRGFKNFKSINR